jgi:hypothetical protein
MQNVFKNLVLNTKQRVDAIHFFKITKVCNVLVVILSKSFLKLIFNLLL